MKVKELIAVLQECDPECLVVMSSDAEGNNIGPLCEASPDWYISDTPWSGDLIADEDLDEYRDEVEAVVCLWPVN